MARLLFLSNGHGEDLNASLIADACRQLGGADVLALPLVGLGQAYRRLDIPVVGPVRALPSGGLVYMNPLVLVQDVLAGLPQLTWQQWQALQRVAPHSDLLVAVGDGVPLTFARLSGRPYVAFIVSTSSYYEGRLQLPALTWWGLTAPRCRKVFTRDSLTAKQLQQQGMVKAVFAGYPIMDGLEPSGQPINVHNAYPVVALLPGSRLPEATDNFRLLLRFCRYLFAIRPQVQVWAALVPGFTDAVLSELAQAEGWLHQEGQLQCHKGVIHYSRSQFADILWASRVVVGMAGTAIEQAVGLGKPVIQIPGRGPQFTYRFAEAQMRLLGCSVQTVGQGPAGDRELQQAAHLVHQIVDDELYHQRCRRNGRERVARGGGAAGIAQEILQLLALPVAQ
ncbi:MAG: lipid-A-disaccharide synthase-related protein [Gloeomargarita sp. SKYBB_i_bin120]|nr:lipid-A-disaccharide synthase-related protein [Gloeomargarita sp. SKYB120]MDW8178186.1 lipid-A-disaccharide synthase-related protein [Gloeomargarita sp. SKYBB_i_bin120]